MCFNKKNALQQKQKRETSSVSLSGWEVGFEPTTSRSTIWRSNQLNYAHHTCGFLWRKSGAKVQTFSKLTKYFFIMASKMLIVTAYSAPHSSLSHVVQRGKIGS